MRVNVIHQLAEHRTALGPGLQAGVRVTRNCPVSPPQLKSTAPTVPFTARGRKIAKNKGFSMLRTGKSAPFLHFSNKFASNAVDNSLARAWDRLRL
jgi:hypothetical protein